MHSYALLCLFEIEQECASSGKETKSVFSNNCSYLGVAPPWRISVKPAKKAFPVDSPAAGGISTTLW